MTKRDYYEILEVSKDATSDEIKKAYRKKAMKYHPDRNQGNQEAEDKFKEASEAYSVLGNAEKKQKYDTYGFAGLNGASQSYSSDTFFSDSIFSDFGDILGDFFGFGSFSGRGRRPRPQQGRDIGVKTTLTMAEAYSGCEKEIDITREINCEACSGKGTKNGVEPETCPQCQGTGSVRRSQGFFSISTTCPACNGTGKHIKEPCPECRGAGRKNETKSINVTFPPGVDTGNKMRVSGEGDHGLRGGMPGDLYLIIELEEDKYFTRDNENLIYEMDITFSQAVLGDSVTIDTFYGEETIKIPSETQGGDIIKIKGKGFKNLHSKKRGDLLVLVQVKTPVKISKKVKELFTQLREYEQENIPASKGKRKGFFH